jgi:hypothetical protein
VRNSLSFLVLSSVCAAQTVSPAAFTLAEAPGSSTTPFGLLANDDRYLQVHGDVTSALTINRIMFRKDQAEGNTSSSVFNATVRLSEAATGVTPATPRAVFSLNHGLGLTIYLALSINMPVASSLQLPSRPFDRVIPLPTPYAFAGGSPLVWEVEFNSRTAALGGAFDFVASLGDPNPVPANGVFGTGCRVSAADAPLDLSIQTSIDWRISALAVRVLCTTSNALRDNTVDNSVFVIFGFSRDSYRGTPLPFLLPLSVGAPSGPCNLYTSIVEILRSGTVNTNTGVSTFVLECPAAPEFNGVTMYLQSIAHSPRANPYLRALSNAAAVNLVAPFGATPIGRVFGNGHGAAVSGVASPASGLVTRFE